MTPRHRRSPRRVGLTTRYLFQLITQLIRRVARAKSRPIIARSRLVCKLPPNTAHMKRARWPIDARARRLPIGRRAKAAADGTIARAAGDSIRGRNIEREWLYKGGCFGFGDRRRSAVQRCSAIFRICRLSGASVGAPGRVSSIRLPLSRRRSTARVACECRLHRRRPNRRLCPHSRKSRHRNESSTRPINGTRAMVYLDFLLFHIKHFVK